jgi:hypothetical protein
MLWEMNNVMSPFSNTSYEKPSVEQVRKMCYDKMRDMLDAEPPKLSVNICMGMVLDELNK